MDFNANNLWVFLTFPLLPLLLAFPFHQRPSASSPTPTSTPSPFPSAAGRAGGAPSRELITNLRAFMPTNCHVFSQVTAQLSRAQRHRSSFLRWLMEPETETPSASLAQCNCSWQSVQKGAELMNCLLSGVGEKSPFSICQFMASIAVKSERGRESERDRWGLHCLCKYACESRSPALLPLSEELCALETY